MINSATSRKANQPKRKFYELINPDFFRRVIILHLYRIVFVCPRFNSIPSLGNLPNNYLSIAKKKETNGVNTFFIFCLSSLSLESVPYFSDCQLRQTCAHAYISFHPTDSNYYIENIELLRGQPFLRALSDAGLLSARGDVTSFKYPPIPVLSV